MIITERSTSHTHRVFLYELMLNHWQQRYVWMFGLASCNVDVSFPAAVRPAVYIVPCVCRILTCHSDYTSSCSAYELS